MSTLDPIDVSERIIVNWAANGYPGIDQVCRYQ